MAVRKNVVKGDSDRFNIRLDADVGRFYRRKANENGKTPSEYLRNLLERGYLADSLDEVEARMNMLIDELKNISPGNTKLPAEILLSIFTTEALLQEIVKDKDQQRLFAAQDVASAKVKKLLNNANGAQ